MGGAQVRKPRVTKLSAVVAEEVEWLWPGRVPLGKLSLFSGDPGLGKSFVTIDMAARVTTGRAWPDKPGEPNPVGSVVLVSCEDGLADTVLPRLKAAGGDPSKVIALEGVDVVGKDGETDYRPFNLADDLAILEQVLIDNPDTRLVIIDPVGAYGGKTDTYKDNQVRAMLAPLGELAERYRVAVVMVAHLSKGKSSNPLYKSMGSIAYVAASRAAWLFFKDQGDPTRRLILLGKLNIAKESTKVNWRKVSRMLSEFFDGTRSLRSITPSEAKDFRQHLIASQYADNTTRKVCSVVRQFFTDAVERGLIESNPFDQKCIPTSTGGNPARQAYVSVETAEAVLNACPDSE